nr:hypothetical protein Ef18B006LT_25610 [Escherichia fergusonii]
MGVVDNMSIEYRFFIDRSLSNALLNKLKNSYENHDIFKVSYSSSDSIGISIVNSESSFGSDFEITIKNHNISLEIHSGNRKDILSFIEMFLINNEAPFEIEDD